jgi:archaellum component FlaC
VEQKRKIERIMERIRRLEEASHPPTDWGEKIERLAKKVKQLSELISKRRK